MASNFQHAGLEAMGYKFNDNLEIRQISNDQPFEFKGQAHYDLLVRKGFDATCCVASPKIEHFVLFVARRPILNTKIAK